MKANVAPKKLYVNFYFIETHPESHQPLVTKQGINKYDIEYVRKDTFIEKACKWLQKEVVEDYAGVVWKGLIEDFKKYMKEE